MHGILKAAAFLVAVDGMDVVRSCVVANSLHFFVRHRQHVDVAASVALLAFGVAVVAVEMKRERPSFWFGFSLYILHARKPLFLQKYAEDPQE